MDGLVVFIIVLLVVALPVLRMATAPARLVRRTAKLPMTGMAVTTVLLLAFWLLLSERPERTPDYAAAATELAALID